MAQCKSCDRYFGEPTRNCDLIAAGVPELCHGCIAIEREAREQALEILFESFSEYVPPLRHPSNAMYAMLKGVRG